MVTSKELYWFDSSYSRIIFLIITPSTGFFNVAHERPVERRAMLNDYIDVLKENVYNANMR